MKHDNDDIFGFVKNTIFGVKLVIILTIVVMVVSSFVKRCNSI